MNIIEKFTAPTDISNQEEYGTKWIANLASGIQIYIQISKDIDRPKWKRLGDICEFWYLNRDIDSKMSIDDMITLFNK